MTRKSGRSSGDGTHLQTLQCQKPSGKLKYDWEGWRCQFNCWRSWKHGNSWIFMRAWRTSKPGVQSYTSSVSAKTSIVQSWEGFPPLWYATRASGRGWAQTWLRRLSQATSEWHYASLPTYWLVWWVESLMELFCLICILRVTRDVTRQCSSRSV